MQEYPLEKRCPCGSRKNYENCCRSKKFKWNIDKDGNTARVISINRETQRIILGQFSKFKKLFGREPAPFDRVLLEAYVSSADDMDEFASKILSDAKMDPAFLYAHKKTGLILTESNQHYIPEKEVRQFKRAVKEYREGRVKKLKPPLAIRRVMTVARSMNDCQVALGRVITLFNDCNLFPEKVNAEIYFCIFCLTRSAKNVNSIQVLIDKNSSADAFALCRCIFENYLHIESTLGDLLAARQRQFAIAGISNNTHQYFVSTNGKVDWKCIVCKNTGEKTAVNFSISRLARSTPFPEDLQIYSQIYRSMSQFIHPDILSLPHYTEDGIYLTASKRTLNLDSLLLTAFFVSLHIDQVSRMPKLESEIMKDYLYFNGILIKKLKLALRSLGHDLSKILISRLNKCNSIHDRDCA